MSLIEPRIIINEFRMYPLYKKELENILEKMKENKEKRESLAQAPIAHYGLEPIVHNPETERERIMLGLISEEMELDFEAKKYQGKLDHIEFILSRLDPLSRDIITDKYIYEKSWDELSEKYILSRSGLDALVRRKLEKLN